jgi:anti-sigma factor RsiW
MTTERCDALKERIPLVAGEEGAWTPEEAAHLGECLECSAEWRLVQCARTLGARSAGGLDHGRLTARVLAEVAVRRRRERWTRRAWLTGLAAAAAVIIVVWTGRQRTASIAAGPDSLPAVAMNTEFYLPLAELEPLDSEQLQAVLDGLDAPVGEVAPGPAPSFGELDDTQLERVLRSLEG